jgi:hypothetical protein
VMLKLRTLKLAAALRQYTKLRPVLRCQTRWSGAFFMTSRYLLLHDDIKKLMDEGYDEDMTLHGVLSLDYYRNILIIISL